MALTSKQWKLYNLLKSEPDKWFSIKEICEKIPEYHYIDDPRNPCVDVGSDRIVINADSQVDKIIVTKKHCFKIATIDEYREERNYHIRKLKTQVSLIEAMDRKFNRNGQVKIFNNVLNELKPENEQYHETFVKDNLYAIYSDKDKKVWIIESKSVLRINTKEVKVIGGKYNLYQCPCDRFSEITSIDEVDKNYKLIDLTKEKEE